MSINLFRGIFNILLLFSGTFAIVCLMTGKVVNQYSTVEILQNGTLTHSLNYDPTQPVYTNVQVATTVTFTVAMFQVSYLHLIKGRKKIIYKS